MGKRSVKCCLLDWTWPAIALTDSQTQRQVSQRPSGSTGWTQRVTKGRVREDMIMERGHVCVQGIRKEWEGGGEGECEQGTMYSWVVKE